MVVNNLIFGDFVKYHLFNDIDNEVCGMFIRSLWETRNETEDSAGEMVELHEIYSFETNKCETVFAFEYAGAING